MTLVRARPMLLVKVTVGAAGLDQRLIDRDSLFPAGQAESPRRIAIVAIHAIHTNDLRLFLTLGHADRCPVNRTVEERHAGQRF